MKNSLILHPHYSNGNGHSAHIPELVFEEPKNHPKNHYEATERNPFHLSVCGLVFDSNGKILVHHLENYKTTRVFFPHLFTLMRETMELKETPEQTLHRGLEEEFGMIGEVDRFLGSLTTSFLRGRVEVQKTTLWFSVMFVSNNLPRHHDEGDSSEANSLLEWYEPNFLIQKMKAQGEIEKNQDESEIIRRFLKYR